VLSLFVLQCIALSLAQKGKKNWLGRDPSKQDKDPWWIRVRRRVQGLTLQHHASGFTPKVIDNFISDEQAAMILDRYQPLLRDSLHNNERTGGASKSSYRTSHSVRLPPLGDSLVMDIEQRAAAAVNLTYDAVEDFQLACYGPGELYGLHRDDHDSEEGEAAHRAATVLIYLRAPTAGGETLFTRQPLEEECEVGNPKQRLRTQSAALELFQSYCRRPKKSFFVATPVVGRAVAWWNWKSESRENASTRNDTTGAVALTRFVRESTHGACPVAATSAVEKCVIQQWIAKSPEYYHPLRRDTVAAIFPLGADASFQEKLQANYRNLLQQDSSPCWTDVSTNQGRLVPTLCTARSVMLQVDGPYGGVGALQVSSRLQAVWSNSSLSDSISISFWVRKVPAGTVLVSLEQNEQTALSATLSNLRDNVHTWQLRQGEDVAEVTFRAEDDEWLWCSLVVGARNDDPSTTAKRVEAELLFQSQRGAQLGSTTLVRSIEATCSSDTDSKGSLIVSLLEPARPVPAEDAADFDRDHVHRDARRQDENVPAQPVDVSFVVLHRTALSLEARRSLRYEIKRYDINS
jgi:hypothetical protein